MGHAHCMRCVRPINNNAGECWREWKMKEIIELVTATAILAVILFILPGAILRWVERARWARFAQAKVWESASRGAIAQMQVGDLIRPDCHDLRFARWGQQTGFVGAGRDVDTRLFRAVNGEWFHRVVLITRVAEESSVPCQQ
jgi:hypothetical protein